VAALSYASLYKRVRLCVSVTFSNLIGDIADATPGADKYDITNAIGQDSRVGTKYLRPGYGLYFAPRPAEHVFIAFVGFGGPCFPRDNRALGGYGEMVGIDALLFKGRRTRSLAMLKLSIFLFSH